MDILQTVRASPLSVLCLAPVLSLLRVLSMRLNANGNAQDDWLRRKFSELFSLFVCFDSALDAMMIEWQISVELTISRGRVVSGERRAALAVGGIWYTETQLRNKIMSLMAFGQLDKWRHEATAPTAATKYRRLGRFGCHSN